MTYNNNGSKYLNVSNFSQSVTNKIPFPIVANIIDAARAINYRCDGAKTLDGQGFNSSDSAYFKRKLADSENLSDGELFDMYHRLRKYSRQLRACGIEYSELLKMKNRGMI